MLDYALTVNGVDFATLVERDSYSTSKVPVWSESVVSMDGITHVVKIRDKNEIKFSFNPQDSSVMAEAFTALLTQPCEVRFYSLQSQNYQFARMIIDRQSASYLSRCLHKGLQWSQMDSITLTEL